MPINLTELTNITGLYSMASYVNSQASGLLFGMLLPVLHIILLLSLRHQGMARALTASSFTCLALSFLFIGLGLVHFTLIIAYVVLTLLGALWLWYEKNSE